MTSDKLEKLKETELRLRLERERIKRELQSVDQSRLSTLGAEKRRELEKLAKEKASLFVCAVGIPPPWVVEKLHAAKIPIMNMIGHPHHVEKALEAGVHIHKFHRIGKSRMQHSEIPDLFVSSGNPIFFLKKTKTITTETKKKRKTTFVGVCRKQK